MRLKIVGDAGTGKTHTIIKYAQAFDARILTHTRVATKVIKQRAPELQCSTLHSLALNYSEFLEVAKNSLKIGIDKIRAEFCRKIGLPFSLDPYIVKEGNVMFNTYCKLVNTLYPDGIVEDRKLERFIRSYETFKRERGYIDYEDMLKYLYDMSELGNLVLGRVIVDEAQDLSPLQYKIINSSSETLIAAGDELQSIFSFHGATPKLFENFGDKMKILKKNYRIKSEIWKFSGEIVKKQLKRERAEAVNEGGVVQILPPANHRQIAEFIENLPGKKMVLLRYNEDVLMLRKMVEDENAIIDTIHACKGLECNTVVLVDGVNSHEFDEEERRVWYVGATRAIDHLIIIPLATKYSFLAYVYDLGEKTSPREAIETRKRMIEESKKIYTTY
ncbi:MAG: UvrD-helicase domain-containing protein [Archaeoglobaceae archaeon]|nr:UvrD-helicase domain-containing protein [Archaeoglobaceae archaeon]